MSVLTTGPAGTINPNTSGGNPNLNAVSSMFPLVALRGGTVSPPVTVKPSVAGTRDFKPVAGNFNSTYNYQANDPFSQNNNTVSGALNYVAPSNPASATSAGLSYIGGHIIYIVVFIIFTLILYYTVGKKSTAYFLILVLLGQLVIGGQGQGIADALNSFGLGGKTA